jgi:pyroglutamyl-peptidase
MPVLVFGFEPFLEFDENPTQLLVRHLQGMNIEGERVTGVVLPVDHQDVVPRLTTVLRKSKPGLALGFGLASGREKVTPEKIAVNYRAAEKADNSGRRMAGAPIDRGGPDGLFTNLPVEGLVAHLNENGIPSSLSLSAGSYICNTAMYVVVREARRRGFAGGFVHVPCHSEWVARKKKHLPSLPLDTLIRGAELSISYCLRNGEATVRPARPRVL